MRCNLPYEAVAALKRAFMLLSKTLCSSAGESVALHIICCVALPSRGMGVRRDGKNLRCLAE